VEKLLKNKIEQLESENQHLKSGIEELSILNEIATAIRSTQSLQQVIDLIIHKCVKYLHVEQGVVLLLDKQPEKDVFRTMIREIDHTSNFLPYRMDTELLGWMIKNKKPLIINNYKNDESNPVPEVGIGQIKSLLAVPLINRDQLSGLIAMFNKKDPDGFSDNDKRLLSIIATQSAQTIENARLFDEERELRRFQEEMRFAKDIQINLLPKQAPALKNYDIAGASIPAKEVGGDYFDFIPISDTQLAFCLGDVSGKGMPAALLMANVQATLRGQAMLKNTPANCLYYSNVLLFNSTSPEKFVTLFYGILNTVNHELTFSNAGHDHPFLFYKKKVKRLETGGIILGFMDAAEYEEDKCIMEKDDVLFVYSDGLTEAMNKNEEEFGEERLEQLFKDSLSLNSKDIIDKVISEIKEFAGDVPQMDDMTIVVIKRVS
jgi:sigma-B regulation protein RsbU (phosphoserine phosphatase)